MKKESRNLWENPNEPYEYHNKNSRKPANKYRIRLLGLGLVAGGAILGYFLIFQKIQQMAEGAKHVQYSMKGIMISPLLLSLGLFLLCAPPKIAASAMQPGGKSKWVWILLTIILGCCCLTYFFVQQEIHQHGYMLSQ